MDMKAGLLSTLGQIEMSKGSLEKANDYISQSISIYSNMISISISIDLRAYYSTRANLAKLLCMIGNTNTNAILYQY